MRWRHLAWLAPALLAGAALALDRAFPPDMGRAGRFSAELRDASGRVLNLRAASDGAIRLAVNPAQVGRDIVPLLLAREDRRFWTMPGVDPLALMRAAGQAVWNGQVVSGGSTIAMQVARLLEPHPRTLGGKVHDILRALQLQARLGPNEILRLYLTLAPMGGNVEGFRAASLLYFGCEPSALTRSQAALLVSLPQSPARRRPDRFPDNAWRGAARVLAAAADPAPTVLTAVRPWALPALARHLAAAHDGSTDTTLDADLQRGVEALAAREAAWLGPDANVAVVVIRNRDRAVLAYLGGTRFFGPAGTVDMVRAPRSPGSALKPFIYGMAFDDGLALPGTPLDDGPLRLGFYAPRDFDRAEHGMVTAAEALRQSLNRPAVRLLARIGPAVFAGRLAAGARLRLPRGAEASAALALGGVGISLLDLAGLYADLASGGAVVAPHVVGAFAAPGVPPRLFSRRAAGTVAGILRGQPAPPGVAADPGHPIGYKTGTSYGYRDSWAAGFTPAYTVVVWAGRPDNTPRPGATGVEAAGPILFRAFGLLPAEGPAGNAAETADPPRLAPALTRRAPRAPLRIMFPPGDVDLAFAPSAPIDLRAAGGTPPYRWMADGVPLPERRPLWMPSGPGFAHLTVVDGAGASASADVRLVRE